MAIRLDGRVEVKRVSDLINKVLSEPDLANYKLIVDNEADDDSFNITLAQLLSFALTEIADNSITNDKLFEVAQNTIKGRISSGTGVVEDLTTTQLTSMLNVFTDLLKGLVPPSGGGTTNFLRADGAWAAAGGGAGVLYSTVGSGGDYTTLKAALDAGKYHIQLISNVTETANITTADDVYIQIYGNGYTINFDDYNLTLPYVFSGCTLLMGNIGISYAFTTSKDLFNFTGFNKVLVIDTCVITNSSTIANTPLVNLERVSIASINKANITVPNFINVFLTGTDLNVDTHSLTNSFITGGGAACRAFGVWGYAGNINNLTLKGTFGNLVLSGAKVVNVRGDAAIGLLISGNNAQHANTDMAGWSNIELRNATLFIYVNSVIATKITNSAFKDIQVAAGSSIDCLGIDLVNVTFTDAVTIAARNAQWANCIFQSTLSVTGELNTFVACRHNENVTVVGNNNTFNTCHVGNVNAGAKTITVNAGSSKTILIGNRTEAAISDSGTGTVNDPTNQLF